MSAFADSRYAQPSCPRWVAVDTGESLVGVRPRLYFPPAPDDFYVPARPNERWENFAYRAWQHAFGDRATRLDWLVLDTNNVVNPFVLPTVGRRYRFLSVERIILYVVP